jgi:hypothetical protein
VKRENDLRFTSSRFMPLLETPMPYSEDELKKALKAFKKRLKLTQLDEDSRLGHSPLTGSGKSKIVSIQPPLGFGREIWEELADKGFLKRDTAGFYELGGAG